MYIITTKKLDDDIGSDHCGGWSTRTKAQLFLIYDNNDTTFVDRYGSLGKQFITINKPFVKAHLRGKAGRNGGGTEDWSDDFLDYTPGIKNGTLDVYSEHVVVKGIGKDCIHWLHIAYEIIIDDPANISLAEFINIDGKITGIPYSCIPDNEKIKITVAPYADFGKGNAALQIKNKYNQWATISSIPPGGKTVVLTYADIKDKIEPGKPFMFRTSKKMSDNSYSYYPEPKKFYYFPEFKLNGSILIEYPACIGASPVIKIPSAAKGDYVITIDQGQGQGWNFSTQNLHYAGGHYIIDGSTPYTNDQCKSNCYPFFKAGTTYNLTIEHATADNYNKNNTPCAFKTTFYVKKRPEFKIRLNKYISYAQNNGDSIQIRRIGSTGRFLFDVSGSPTPQIKLNCGGWQKSYLLTNSTTIDGVKYYSGTFIPMDASAGTSQFVVTSGACAANTLDIVMKKANPVSFDTLTEKANCHFSAIEGNENNIVRIVNIKGGVGAYSYRPATLFNGSEFVLPDSLYGGKTVTVTVEDAFHNTASKTISTPSVKPVTYGYSAKAPSLYCQKDGEVAITLVENGERPYSFSTINEIAYYRTDSTLTGFEEGPQQLFIRDNLGCTYRKMANVPSAPPPMARVAGSATRPTCFEGGNSSYSCELSNIVGGLSVTSDDPRITSSNIDVSGNSVTFSDLMAGEYTFRATDTLHEKSCDSTFTFRIEEKGALSITDVEIAPVIGKGTPTGKIGFDVSGGNPGTLTAILYDGYSALDTIITTGTAITFENLPGKFENSGKLYSIEIIDNELCSYSADNGNLYEFRVKEPEDTLKIELELVSPISCNGMEDAIVKVNPSGGWGSYTYAHEEGLLFVASDLFSGLKPGEHEFFLSDSMGALDSTQIEIIMPGAIICSLAGIDSVLCYNTATGTARFNVSGGTAPYRFAELSASPRWTSGETANDLPEGHYAFIFTDTNGCAGEDTLLAYVPSPDTLDFIKTSVVQTTCNSDNGSIGVELTGGTQPYTYEWHDIQGGLAGTAPSLENLPQSGYYFLDVTDRNGCTQHFEQAINPSDGPRIDSVLVDHVKCWGDNSGSAKVVEVVAATPYAPWWLTWQDSSTGGSTTGLSAGLHYVSVSDSNGCVFTKYFRVESPDSLYVEITDSKAPHCYGYNDAFIEVGPVGGAGGYTFLWSNGNTSDRAENLTVGNYTLTMTDTNKCVYSKSFEVDQPDQVLVDLGKDFMICPNNTVFIDGQDYPAHSWTVQGEQVSDERYLAVGAEGAYCLEVTDSTGCKAYDTIHVAVGDDALQAEFLITSQSYLGDTLRVFELSNMVLDSMRWEFNNEELEDVTPDNMAGYILWLNTLKEGMFNVSLYAYSGGCYSRAIKQVEIVEASDTIDGNGYLGYKEPLITGFSIAPNPNDGYFNVKVRLREEADIRLLVFDVNMGTKIHEKEGHGLDAYELDYAMDNLNSGVYLVVLTAKDERRQIKMIIER